MLQVLSYNILLGGTPRVDALTEMIRSTNADLVGLAEATDPSVVEELAHRLNMHYCLTGKGKGPRDWQVALLSRFPILAFKVHEDRKIFTRYHILEATVQEPSGSSLTAFVLHLTANFHKGKESNLIRRQEIEETLRLMQAYQGLPHLVMGDFNSISPHDPFKASILLTHMMKQFQQQSPPPNSYDPKRRKAPLPFRIIRRLMPVLLRHKLSRFLMDQVSPAYARGGIDLLLQAGYADCFRTINPKDLGFTFHSAALCGRIDYIFASPELAPRLCNSHVIHSGGNAQGEDASDHLPVYAAFD